MGNRGCLHNDQQEIIRRHQVKRWIYCRLQYKDMRRPVMSPGKYTELFFLDEVTALSAGHRPCGFCMKEKLAHFKHCWNKVQSEGEWSLEAIDDLLHQERMKKDYPKATLANLPSGVFVKMKDVIYLVESGDLKLWSFQGYGHPIPKPKNQQVELITPPSIVKLLKAGYPIN